MTVLISGYGSSGNPTSRENQWNRFRARPWDLDQAESTCTTCAVGCRMVLQSSRDRLVRFLGMDDDAVNHGWLCDKGRFGHESVDHEDRIRAALSLPPVHGDEVAQRAG